MLSSDAGAVAERVLIAFLALSVALAGADALRRTSILRSIVRFLSSSSSWSIGRTYVERRGGTHSDITLDGWECRVRDDEGKGDIRVGVGVGWGGSAGGGGIAVTHQGLPF